MLPGSVLSHAPPLSTLPLSILPVALMIPRSPVRRLAARSLRSAFAPRRRRARDAETNAAQVEKLEDRTLLTGVPFTVTGSPLTFNFQGYTGAGFSATPGTGQLDSDQFIVTGASDGDLAYRGEGTTGDFARGASDGGVSTGGVYAFNIGGGDIIFGVQPTGSDFTPGALEMRVQNQTGGTITSVDVSYVAAVFNNEARQSFLDLQFATGGETRPGTFVDAFPGRDAITGTAPNSPPWFQDTFGGTLNVSIAAGEYLYLQWLTDDDIGSGSRDELGIDDISLTPNGGTNTGGGAPTLVSTTPADDATNVPAGQDITLNFSETVQAGTGNVTLRNADTNAVIETIPIADPRVTFSGSTVTVNPAGDLPENANVAVRIDPGAILDAQGNAFAGIGNDTDFNFRTGTANTGGGAPTLVSTDPADDATNVAAGRDLTLTFSETVRAGSGNVTLRNVDTNAVIETIAVTDASRVTFSGSTVTVNPAGDLPENANVAVRIDPGAILDAQGNAFAGIGNDTDFNFRTGTANTGTGPTVVSRTPQDNAANVPVGQDITLTFSENVQAGSGNVTLRNVDTNAVIESIPINDPRVSFSGSTVTIDPTGDLPQNANVAVRIDPTAIRNAQGETFAGFGNDTDFNFSTGNGTAGGGSPTLQSTTPSDNATNVPAGQDLTLTFSEAVQAGSGTITLRNTDTGQVIETIAVTDASRVTFSGSTVTVNPTNDLPRNTNVAVRIDPGAILDAQGNAFAGIGNDTDFNFSTGDAETTAPTLTGTTPADNAMNVAAGRDLTLTFSETVRAGSGNVTLRNTNTGQVIEAIPINDPRVTFSGSTVTVNPAGDLPENASVAVRVDAGAIEDVQGNAFAGINDDTTFNFSTGDADATAPTLQGTTPADNAMNVPTDQDLTLTFSETVRAGTGNITLRNLSTGQVIETIAVTDASRVTFSGSTVTVNPAGDLPENASVSVQVEAGAIRDLENNAFAGINDNDRFNFTTGTETVGGGAPTLQGTTPADNAMNVPAGQDLTLTFSETVRAGSGTITLRNPDTGQVIETIAVTDASRVTFSGSTVTVNPTNPLPQNANVAVRVDAGAIEDVQGNAFAGINDDTTFNFSTGDADTAAPTVTITDDSAGGQAAVGDVVTFTLQFNEVVTGVEAGDLSNAGTAAGNFSNFTAVDGDTYTVRFTPTGAGTIRLQIDNRGEVIQDRNGNDLVTPATDDTVITVNETDTTAPTVSVSNDVASGGGQVRVGDPVTFTLQFDEDVTGVELGDFSNAGTASGRFSNLMRTGGTTTTGGNAFTVQFTPTTEGSIRLQIDNQGAAIQDGSGNALDTPVTDSVTIFVNGSQTGGEADLGVTIGDSPDPVVTGGTVTYTVTVTNGGALTVTGAALDNVLTFAGGTFSVSNAMLIFSGGGSGTVDETDGNGPDVTDLTLAGNETATLTFDVTAESGTGTLTNDATLTAGDRTDPNPVNDTARETTAVNSGQTGTGADLGVTIDDSPDPIETGGTVTYTVTVTNDGPEAVAGATLDNSVTFPGGTFTVANATLVLSGGGSGTVDTTDGDGPEVTDLMLASGETATLTFDVTAETGSGTITNDAALTAGDQSDPNAVNDTASESTAVDAGQTGGGDGDIVFISDGSATPPPNPNGRTREIIAGAGQDLTIDVGSAFYPNGVSQIILDRSAPALRSLTILGDDASDDLRVTIEEGANAGGLRFYGGSGAETVMLNGAAAGLSFFGGDGDDVFMMGSNGSISTRGTLTVRGEGGDDMLMLANVSAGRINADGGEGDDTMSLADSGFRGSVNLQGGGGGDTIDVLGVSARGNVGVNASRGEDGVDTITMSDVSAGGRIAVLTGGEDDTVTLSNLSGTRLNASVGDGDDTLDVTDGDFRSTVNLQAGGGGDEVTLSGVTARGNVGVNASRGESGSDTVSLDGVFAGNVMAILTGDDADDVDLTDVSARRFNVRLNGGDDTLDATDLAVRSGGRNGNFQLGEGDDTANLTTAEATDSAFGVNAADGDDAIIASAVTGFPYVLNAGDDEERGRGSFSGIVNG